MRGDLPAEAGEARRQGAAGRRMRILVVNWQDRRNPQAGGAEVHLHEIFGRLAAHGHTVTLLASGWRGCPSREEVDGLDVHRAGGRHTFPAAALRAYRSRLRRERFDLVVEDINKLPLYTPLWAGAPVVGLVPHLFGTTAFREASWPVAATVWAAERLMPLVYRGTSMQAISRSTADDLVRRGFRRGAIRIIYPGVDHDVHRPGPGVSPFPEPTAVHVGRLKRYKGLDVAFRALRLLDGRGVPLRLLVAGRGDDERRLRRVARDEGVERRVEFLGYVSQERKVELLRRAWVNIYPSPKEGWGMTNVEAAACGIPTVASDAPGLRESVVDGETGFLVAHGDEAAWADRLEILCTDERLRRRLAQGALRHAARFSWERAAEETEDALLAAARAGSAPREGPVGEGGEGAAARGEG